LNVVHASAAQTPRQRRHQANLGRILDAATELVVHGGFDALSMGRLARELDYTAGALYRYYPGKDALIAAMTAKVIRGFTTVLTRVGDLVPTDAHLQQVLIPLLTYRDLGRAAPHRFGLLSMLLATPHTLVADDADAAPAMEAITAALTPLAIALETARAHGALRFEGDSASHAVVAFSAVHGLLQLRKQEHRVPALFDLDGLVRLSLHSLLVGWGAEPAELDAALLNITALGDLVARAGGLP
jgi:AcrR family transcriptional regulator